MLNSRGKKTIYISHTAIIHYNKQHHNQLWLEATGMNITANICTSLSKYVHERPAEVKNNFFKNAQYIPSQLVFVYAR